MMNLLVRLVMLLFGELFAPPYSCVMTYLLAYTYSIALAKRNFTLKYDTNIPRQVVSL